MKYRVMTSEGEIIDKDTRLEADIILAQKKANLENMETVDGQKPFVTIHDCGHEDGTPCINWERYYD